MSQKNRSLAALWLVSPSFTSSSKSSGSGSVCRLAEAERLNNPDEEGVGVELSGDSGKTVVGVQVELESPRSELQIKSNNPERRTRKRTRNPRTIEYGLPTDPNGRHYSLHVRRQLHKPEESPPGCDLAVISIFSFVIKVTRIWLSLVPSEVFSGYYGQPRSRRS